MDDTCREDWRPGLLKAHSYAKKEILLPISGVERDLCRAKYTTDPVIDIYTKHTIILNFLYRQNMYPRLSIDEL